jgi:hypothetical protein
MANIYQNALNSQNACNLSGIVKTLAQDLDIIWNEARAQNAGTDYVNTHPVVRLYVEQLVSLNKSGVLLDSASAGHDAENPFNTYSNAYSKCRERAETKGETL